MENADNENNKNNNNSWIDDIIKEHQKSKVNIK